jgi:ATP-dependent DNA helicase DinG
VVFDEAHQLNETGVQFLGHQLGSSQLIDLARDTLATGLTQAQGLVDWSALCAKVEQAARDWRLVLERHPRSARLAWAEASPQGVDEQAWMDSLQAVQFACEQLAEGLGLVMESSPDFVRLQERVSEVLVRLQGFRAPAATGCVRWVDVNAHIRLMEAPLDIAATVKERMLGAGVTPVPPPEENSAEPVDASSIVGDVLQRSWIFTSATLGDEPALRWFTEPCGLESARVLQVSSPFDYARQAVLFVPRDLVLPSDPQHSQQVGELALQIIKALRGRTLVLTTTLRALQAIGEQLQQALAEDTHIEVLIQGQGSKRELMERFRAGDGHDGRGCVLVASATFWEGFDVPGDALQAVIIDKLPFPPPNDPVVQARSDRLTEQGRSPFKDYFLPEAAVSLKQGAGRLIRRETDRGVLVVCDTRLSTTGYGRRLMAALPPMAKVSSRDVLLQGLARLTTASTKAS